jgi:hypothetical protein
MEKNVFFLSLAWAWKQGKCHSFIIILRIMHISSHSMRSEVMCISQISPWF